MTPKKKESVSASDDRRTNPQPPRGKSVLCADMVIIGELRSKGEVEIHGVLEGTTDCSLLTIAEDAEVRGTIVADTLRVEGSLDGKVRAKSLSIKKTAHVRGEILYDRLAIEAGSFVEANTQRLNGTGPRTATLASLSPDHSGEDSTIEIDDREERRLLAAR